jgi:hypothetical protein
MFIFKICSNLKFYISKKTIKNFKFRKNKRIKKEEQKRKTKKNNKQSWAGPTSSLWCAAAGPRRCRRKGAPVVLGYNQFAAAIICGKSPD